MRTWMAGTALSLMLVTGIASAQETTIVSWEFTTDGNTEGWTALHSLSPLQVAAGALRTTITGSDPYMAGPWGLSIPGDSAIVILIRMRISGNQRDAEFFWTTTQHPNFVAGLEAGFTMIPDGRFHEYEVPVGRNANWKGTITRLRLDPGPGIAPGQDPVPVEIDYIRVVQRGARPQIQGFSPAKSWIARGDDFLLHLRVANVGARVLTGATATLTLPPNLSTGDPLTVALPNIQPGATAELDWHVHALEAGLDTARVVLEAEGIATVTQTVAVPVHEPLAELPPEIPAAEQVVQLPDGSWLLENSLIRLAARRTDSTFGLLSLYVAEGGAWHPFGTLRPPALALVPQTGGIVRPPVPFSAVAAQEVAGRHWLVVASLFVDPDGTNWHVTAAFSLKGDSLRVIYTFVPGADERMASVEGPALRLGDGAFGDEKDAAIFPGLEWLVDGEASSSTLDVREPRNRRFIPNPYRVTAPYMSLTSRGWTVLFSWDPQAEWAPGQRMPNPVFASPDVLENLRGHLLGLTAPPVGRWRSENELAATDPFPVAAGTQLKLEAKIVFLRHDDPLSGLRRWVGENGFPTLPRPALSEREALHRGLRCFMLHLWVPSQRGWHLVLDDPWGPRFDGNVATDVWLSTLFESGVALGSGTRHTLARAARALVDEGKAGALEWDFAFRAGYLDDAWTERVRHAVGLTFSQRADGGWDYSDDPALQNMPGTTLGTCARRAVAILKAARISGNAYLKQRGLKALEFMKRFRVPRGAQTWEVPLHAPDVLASANAVEAYLEGFRLTGRQDYVDRAVYWAETSLPFLYLWKAEDRPIMPFGSIPVFGATWYTGAWFGNVVQWNGLELAYGLSKLAEVTGDTTWQYVARGLVRFGMQLQDYTAAHFPEDAGMYPDAFDMTTGEEAYHWDLSPELVQRNLLRFQGLDPDVSTVLVPVESDTLHVSAGWPVEASRSDSVLVVRLHPAVDDSGWVAVAGVALPRHVRVGGRALSRVQDPDEVREGWSYSPLGVLFVKTFAASPETRIEIAPAKGLPTQTEPRWNFNQPDYLEGWTPNQYLRDVHVADGLLSAVSTWIDPYLEGPFGEWPADSYDSLVVVMALDRGNTGQIFWSRTDAPWFSESKSVHFSLQTDGRLHRIAVALRGHPEWRGTVLRLRLDPTDAESARVQIDAIRLTGGTSGVRGGQEMPRVFALSPAFPNPFNPETRFVLDLPGASRVRVSVFDVLGREVVRLVGGRLPAGRHRLRWDGRTRDGRPLPSGVYVIRARAEALGQQVWHARRKVVLLR